MKKHWKWFVPVVLILLAFGFIFLNDSNNKEDVKNPTVALPNPNIETDEVVLDTITKGPNDVNVPEKAHVFLIENELINLSSNDELNVTIGKIGDKLPKDTRFVLVPIDMELSQKEKTQLQEWVDNKVSILFFGMNVDAKKSLDILGVDKEVIDVQSNADLHNIAYGYGYSYEYGANIPLFIQTNSTNEDKLTDYIGQFVYKKRGF